MLALVLTLALQTPPTSPPHERRTIIDMDADIIEASPLGPKDTVVLAHPRPGFRSLIQVRASFARELLASEAQLK